MKRPIFWKKQKRAIALITVLLLVSLLAILILSIFVTSNTEHRASISYADTQRAKVVAQGALAHAVETLRVSIPSPAGIDKTAETAEAKNWAINPGRLTVFDDKGNETFTDLHTGAAEVSPTDTNDPDVHSVDLNEPIPGKEEPTITYQLNEQGLSDPEAEPPPMRVKWVNSLHDPTEPASKVNPIIARHAFWIDDESGKLNFNTALGKPTKDNDPEGFHRQNELGMMPALFRQGAGDVEYNLESDDREWGLGKLRSVNLDVLFPKPSQLDKDSLIGHTFLRGFSRYPEAILNHVDMTDREKFDWWHQNKYQLTFYSRSPEFNAFGRPRFTTTNIPLSLEGGPNYQMPFLFKPEVDPETPEEEIEGVLHLHSLLGSMGFTHGIWDGEDEGGVHAANLVNRYQAEMMMRYLGREYPGFESEGSFIDKYGDAEAAQITLNLLNMARFATTTMSNNWNNYSRDLALRSTSVLYSPHSKERPRQQPEKHYWRFDPGSGEEAGKFLGKDEETTANTILMIPQTPGPHITEVRMVFRTFPARESPPPLPEEENFKDNPIHKGKIIPGKKWLGFRYEVEYYAHGVGPNIRMNQFPFKVDYLSLELSGGSSFTQELGVTSPDQIPRIRRFTPQDWNFDLRKRMFRYDADGNKIVDENGRPRIRRPVNRRHLGSLQARAGRRNRIHSYDPNLEDEEQKFRKIITTPWRYVGLNKSWLGNPEDPKPQPNDHPGRFSTESSSKISIKFRGGMGVSPAGSRPRQMIPLGETSDDVLEGEVQVNFSSNEPISISWQIEDPRLSGSKSQWWVDSPGDNSAGTMGRPNEREGEIVEPEEDSSEKSKFRYIQRGPGQLAGYRINRPDEYNSRSRISSKGFWSMIHTGIQNEEPWRTLRLSPSGAGEPTGLPDWLLLDLIGGTYPLQHDQWRINSTLPDEFSTVSYMHSTTGAININTKTYPDDSPYFQAPERTKPVEAVFKNLRSDESVESFVSALSAAQKENFFRYVGEISEVEGYQKGPDSTQFENEEYLRNMIGCLTTKSNTFGVWGVGQVIKKTPGNEQWDRFEDGDLVQGEKRFFAIVERYIWPGKDGVPGNAHVNSQGVWDRHAKQRQDIVADGSITDRLFQLPGSPPTWKQGNQQRLRLDLQGTYPEYDGPQEVFMDRYAAKTLGNVKWTHSPLEEAYNPPQPAIKYKVVYLKYLDE